QFIQKKITSDTTTKDKQLLYTAFLLCNAKNVSMQNAELIFEGLSMFHDELGADNFAQILRTAGFKTLLESLEEYAFVSNSEKFARYFKTIIASIDDEYKL